ncbi:MAG TPA: alpha/beta fold hydrolase [bacterium]|nr:alpha/beta fold hydrolase [bacterium]
MSVVETPVRLVNDEGLPVRCDVRRPEGEGPFPVVVILHGFKGFKDWGMFPPTARLLAERGLASVAMNTSRNGVEDRLEEFTDLEAFARNTPGRELGDVRTVVDAIAAGELGAELDAERTGILGHSRGGGVAVLAAASDERLRCLVTWASIARFLRYSERALAEWRRTGRLEVPNARTGQLMRMDLSVLEDLEANQARYDLDAAAARLTVPYLAVHGERDEAVGPDDSARLVERAGSAEKRLHVIPRTGHTFGAAHPWNGGSPAWEEAVRETAEWFARWLAVAPG